MLDAYSRWIENYVARQPNRFVRGLCDEATEEMVAAFPELRRACGFVLAPWGEDQHWWCVAPDGTIVDPTASQFPTIGGYEEIDPTAPHRPIPTGVCMDCGDAVFDYATFCNDNCERATRAYLGL